MIAPRSVGVRQKVKYLDISTSSKESILIIFLMVTVLPIPLPIARNNVTNFTLGNSVILLEVIEQKPDVLH